MAITLAQDVRQGILDSINTQVNAGAAAAKVRIYDDSPPANADTALDPANTLLVEFTLNDPAFAPATAATPSVLTLDVDPALSATAAAAGTATFARVVDSDGNVVFQGTVGTAGADFIISSTTITAGQTVNLTAGTLTL